MWWSGLRNVRLLREECDSSKHPSRRRFQRRQLEIHDVVVIATSLRRVESDQNYFRKYSECRGKDNLEINDSEFCSSLVVLEHGALEESCLAFLIACFDVNFGHGYESGNICKLCNTDN